MKRWVSLSIWIAILVMVSMISLLILTARCEAGPPRWRPMPVGDEVLVMRAGQIILVLPAVKAPKEREGPPAPPPPPPPGPPKVRVGTEP